MRSVLAVAALGLVLAPPVLGAGVTGPDARYATAPASGGTLLTATDRATGVVRASRRIDGAWRIPVVTVNGETGGLSPNGKVLVLADASPRSTAPTRTSRLLVVDTKGLRVRGTIRLRGDFAFDALSPAASTLYLIQHVSAAEPTRYRVRAYDLRANRLIAGAIAEKGQQDWTMRGLPVARATSGNGQWVYTLYRQRSNVPFVHALDTVDRFAVCVAVPEQWRDGDGTLRLTGHRLLIGNPVRYILDTQSFRMSAAPPEHRPQAALAALGGGSLLLAGALLAVRRSAPSLRRRRSTSR